MTGPRSSRMLITHVERLPFRMWAAALKRYTLTLLPRCPFLWAIGFIVRNIKRHAPPHHLLCLPGWLTSCLPASSSRRRRATRCWHGANRNRRLSGSGWLPPMIWAAQRRKYWGLRLIYVPGLWMFPSVSARLPAALNTQGQNTKACHRSQLDTAIFQKHIMMSPELTPPKKKTQKAPSHFIPGKGEKRKLLVNLDWEPEAYLEILGSLIKFYVFKCPCEVLGPLNPTGYPCLTDAATESNSICSNITTGIRSNSDPPSMLLIMIWRSVGWWDQASTSYRAIGADRGKRIGPTGEQTASINKQDADVILALVLQEGKIKNKKSLSYTTRSPMFTQVLKDNRLLAKQQAHRQIP